MILEEDMNFVEQRLHRHDVKRMECKTLSQAGDLEALPRNSFLVILNCAQWTTQVATTGVFSVLIFTLLNIDILSLEKFLFV